MSTTEKLGIPSFMGWMFNHGWLSALLAAWLVSPVVLYVIALLFEKRLAPIWRYQFYSFNCDLFLGGIIASSVALAADMPSDESSWFHQEWWNILCVAFGVVVFVVGHFMIDKKHYTSKQKWSPSKLYHDVVLFLGYGTLLLKVGLPTLVHGAGVIPRVVTAVCVLVFFVALYSDARVDGYEKTMMYRHAHPRRGWCFILSSQPFINSNRS